METLHSSKQAGVCDKVNIITALTITALETYMASDPEDVYGLINKTLLYDNVTDIIAEEIKSNLKM